MQPGLKAKTLRENFDRQIHVTVHEIQPANRQKDGWMDEWSDGRTLERVPTGPYN